MREKADRRRRFTQPLKESSLVDAALDVQQLDAEPEVSTPSPTLGRDAKESDEMVDRMNTKKQTLSAQKSILSVDRALEIQKAIGAYFDSVLRPQGKSDADVDHMSMWTSAFLKGKGASYCSSKDLSVVLRAMEREDKIVMTDNNTRVWVSF